MATLPARSEAASEIEFRSWTQAPAFTLPALSGETARLDALRGRIVVVHFFATWCAPCRKELPALQRFAARAEPSGITVLTVSVAEPDDRVRRFAETLPLSLPVLLDRDRAVTRAWDVAILPSTVVLGPDLTPRLGVEGDIDWDRIAVEDLMTRVRQNTRQETAPQSPRDNEPAPGGH